MKKKSAPQDPKTSIPYPLQDRIWQRLQNLKSRMPSVLIFSGASGIGKFHHTQLYFQSLVCTESTFPCGKCEPCQKVLNGNHPDFFVIQPHGEQIQIEDVAQIGKQICFAPLESPLRFIVINEAHKLNHTSSNALLKTLEEPPAHTRFFLLTSDRQLLLPTINSRGQFFFFAPLSLQTIEGLLDHCLLDLGQSVSAALRPYLLQLCGDGAARLETLLEPSTLTSLEKIIADPKTLHEELSSEQTSEKLLLILDFFTIWFKNLALRAVEKDKIWSFIQLAQQSCYLKKRLHSNANKKLIALRTSQFLYEMSAL